MFSNSYSVNSKRDIQCEKFIEDESVSHEPCDSMYPNSYYLFICLLHKINKRFQEFKLCYAGYEKPLKNHHLDVAKKYVETHSSSNAAVRDAEERAFYN